MVMAKTDDLVTALEQLEQAVGAPAADPERVEQGLARLEQALARRTASLRSPDARVVDVDRPLLPSPGEDRKAADLQHELEDFLGQTKTLREQTRGTTGAVADAPALRDRVRELIQAIRRHEHAEVELILDSVNTDIGAGD